MSPLAAAILEFALLAAVIIVAGTVLTRCADALADITGLGRLLVGSILLAAATSLPELTVDLSALRLVNDDGTIGRPDLAVGDLIGSSLMNLLILAVMDLTQRSKGKMLSRAAAAHALSGTLGIALTSIVGVGILVAPHAPDLALLGVHATMWALLIGYIMGVRMVFLDQRLAARQAVESGAVSEHAPSQRKLSHYLGGFAAAAAVIVLAGPRMAEAAGVIADESGLGGSFVGTTFVALSTSLPELVASITAIRLGAFDLIIGNVFGSNAFNMVLFVVLDFAFPGSLFAVVNQAHLVSVFSVIVATSVVIMGQLYLPDSRVRLIEPDALLVIALVCGALYLVYATS